MTVEQLIATLCELPPHAVVLITVGGVPGAPLIGPADDVSSDNGEVFISASSVS